MGLINVLAELLVIWCVMKHALEMKYSVSRTIVVYAVSFLVIGFTDLGPVVNWLLMWFAMLLPVFLMYRGSVWIKIFWIVVYCCLKVSFEAGVLLFAYYGLNISLNTIETHISYMAFFSVLTNFLIILAVEFFNAIRGRQRFQVAKAYRKEILAFSIVYVILVFFCIFCMHYYSRNVISNPQNLLTMFLLGILLVSGASMWMFFRILDTSQRMIEENKQIQRLENEIQFNGQLRETEKNLRVLRHNVNNTFGIIKGLLNVQEYEKLNEYLNSVYQEVEGANELVLLENKALAVLLNEKKKLAVSHNIDYQSMINFQKSPLPDKELCDLVGNMMDNAVEAAREASGIRYIRLKIQENENLFEIECENSYQYEPIVQNDFFLSRKKKEALFDHGIGTKNIREIVDRFGGIVQFTFDSGVFYVKGSIPYIKFTETEGQKQLFRRNAIKKVLYRD